MLALLLAGPLPPARAETAGAAPVDSPTEYAVVAHYLAVFLRYVTWPESPVAAGQPWHIGVLGRNPFDKELDRVLAGRSLRGRPLAAAYAATPEKLPECQVVFIPAAETGDRGAALAAFAGKPVLTVVYLGAAAEAPATGAAIELVRTGRNVRYRLNAAALAAQGLQPTPGLLENALRRGEGPAP
jgi:hypothetical protein